MWVARDKDGTLFLYQSIPDRGKATFEPNDGSYMDIDSDLFPDLKFEDEPIQVSLCLNNERYHTVKHEELNRLYEIDWRYSDMKETLESYQAMIENYRRLPWYKRIIIKI
ncbi:MAG: hypothetical protein KBT34_05545 [Prevotella sp.]|nr:hypothetical protein [Candidatus Prevotella equi]